MRILLQRVQRASVQVDNLIVGEIKRGLLLLVGIGAQDTESVIQPQIDKLLNLRIFPKSEQSGFDQSIRDIAGGILIVSQFTLYADYSRGRRPGFSDALPPKEAQIIFNQFCDKMKASYKEGPVAQGIFGAYMQVELENDGPVTIMLEN